MPYTPRFATEFLVLLSAFFELYAGLLRQFLQRFCEGPPMAAHRKINDVPAGSTRTEAAPRLANRIDYKLRRFFAVERTWRFICASGFLERHILLHIIYDVEARFDFVSGRHYQIPFQRCRF